MGPLSGVKIIEIASLAPAPFGTTILADLGAEVTLIDRPGGTKSSAGTPKGSPARRGRKSITLDLKKPEAIEVLLKLCDDADVFIEGFRPGVTERLGLGPEELAARNPRLVYARMTGWGQEGPLAQTAGHDIDYIAMSGILSMIGRAGEKPYPPLNLVGDFGGGGMLMAMGIVTALFEREKSGKGQVVDAAMVDGAAQLSNFVYGLRAAGAWNEPRGENLLDTGSPFYDTYECADGGYVAVGAIEPQFYAELLKGLQLDPASLPAQHDRTQWVAMKKTFTDAFLAQPRSHWEKVFDGTDACVAPVLTPEEAFVHPANTERGVFFEMDGVTQPAPAPRFSRTPAGQPKPGPATQGVDTDAILAGIGLSGAEIESLRKGGALG
ncbi:alpha-methylacyl-CoA racemase [Antricoccus suffuscus]|uniref:Alpha-methylacyl-CoA racemase n=1 Tax=Antricoccus suffuscus TaxID=1629062 RepID=A0A2T1A1G1_9ACTN|nr:CaiB/BaiF CoA-transferase family protein [Antricoccus suffuscus]PRZ42450.1 alpha-methylacyl-CoA racemase [Antricoccus suffuscus]